MMTNFGKILLFFYVIIEKKPEVYDDVRVIKMNPYNPISWIIIVLLFIVFVFLYGIPESIKGIKQIFSWFKIKKYR